MKGTVAALERRASSVRPSPFIAREDSMARVVKCGLIQCGNVINDESRPVAEIQKAMFDKHIPLIEEAGKKGVKELTRG